MDQDILDRASRIHPEGLGNGKEKFRKCFEMTRNNPTETNMANFKTILEQAEEKNKTYLGHIKQLEEKYAIFNSIITHPSYDSIEKNAGWNKSFNPVEGRLKDFQFDENGKYISGKLNKQILDHINLTVLSKMWKEKLSAQRNAILFAIPKWLQENSSLIIADDDAKEKSERINELISQIKLDETHDLTEVQKLSDELMKSINKGAPAPVPSPPKNKRKEGGGKCGECGKQVLNLFGSSRSCGECFDDGEFQTIAEKLQKKIDLWEKKDRKSFQKFEETDYSDFQDACNTFSEKHTLDNYNKMMSLFHLCEKKVPISDDDLKPLRGESESDEDEDEDESSEESSSSSSELSSEEPEYIPRRRGKKRSRDEEEEGDIVKEVLETLVVATIEDKQDLLDKYNKDTSCLKDELEQIRKKRTIHYAFSIYFMLDGKKQPIPHGDKKEVFTRQEEAAKCAQKWIDNLGEAGSAFKYDVVCLN